MKKLLILAALALAFASSGCETLKMVDAAVPDTEICFVYKGRKLCAIKRDGKWFLAADLTPEEHAEVSATLPK